jgi:hypothetical protein
MHHQGYLGEQYQAARLAEGPLYPTIIGKTKRESDQVPRSAAIRKINHYVEEVPSLAAD